MENTLAYARNMDPVYPRFKDIFVGIDIFGRNQVGKLDTYKTLEKIPERMSVALFAVGWTLESVEHEMREERKSFPYDETNKRFLARDVKFWEPMWKSLDLFGPKQLPFYTSFCMGSGNFSNRLGMMVKRRPWFNLTHQDYQPSVVAFNRNFDDAFDGGSCLIVTETLPAPQRLLVCQFERIPGLVVSVCFKRSIRTSVWNLWCTSLVHNFVSANFCIWWLEMRPTLPLKTIAVPSQFTLNGTEKL